MTTQVALIYRVTLTRVAPQSKTCKPRKHVRGCTGLCNDYSSYSTSGVGGCLNGVSFPRTVPGLPMPWKLAYEVDIFDKPVFLHLDQTVQDLPKGRDVFLVPYMEELPWN